MITAVDTNVLLDVLVADAVHGPSSRDALQAAIREGALIACDVVWAETTAWFPSTEDGERLLDHLGVRLVPLDVASASAAGTAWREYRRGGGKRERVIADVLVAAHANIHADRLLTRDRGFYRSRFKQLTVVDPSV